MPVVELFRALGEPTRLQMLERLSSRGTHTISSLSAGLNITRQGARKHLQILEDSDLVKMIQKGRNTNVELNYRTLEVGKRFITKLELQWEKRLEALKDFVEKE